MACQSCHKAREAVSASVRALVSGNPRSAAGEASKAVSAVAEKIEASRVRAILTRRSIQLQAARLGVVGRVVSDQLDPDDNPQPAKPSRPDLGLR